MTTAIYSPLIARVLTKCGSSELIIGCSRKPGNVEDAASSVEHAILFALVIDEVFASIQRIGTEDENGAINFIKSCRR